MALRFLDFEVDPAQFRLTQAGEPIAIERRVLDLLIYLIQNRGRIVPREELLREVWQGVAVTDHVLAQALHTARKLLSDNANSPQILRTVRGRGVEFVAGVVEVGGAGIDRELVGREAELRRLGAGLSLAAAGTPLLALVFGEPGIGKSSLCDTMKRAAEGSGWRVLSGQCWQGEGAPFLRPWRQILEQFLEEQDEAERVAWLDEYPELSMLFGSVSNGMSSHSQETSLASRQVSLERIWRFWRQQAIGGRVLFVIEDIHKADESTMEILKIAFEGLQVGTLAIVCTFRPSEIHSQPILEEFIGALDRAASMSLKLGRLSQPESLELAGRLGSSLREEELGRLYERSGGNPLFWHRLHRLRVDGFLEEQPMPKTVRAAVLEHLRRLDLGCQQALEVAAVAGCEFSVIAVAAAMETGVRDLLVELQPAIDAEIVAPRWDALDSLEFSHAIVRDAIYEDLSEARRRVLHSDIARAWPSSSSVESRAGRAHHFISGMPEVSPLKAIRFAVEAGCDAVERMAFEQAFPLLEKAKHLSSTFEMDPELRCRMLLGLAECQIRKGDRASAAANLRESAELADSHEISTTMSQVALRSTPGLLAIDTLRRDPLSESLLRRAYSADHDQETKSLLAAKLAMALYWVAGTSLERKTLAAEAVAHSLETSDPARRGMILAYQIGSLWDTDGLEARRRDADQVVALGRIGGDAELESLGHIFLVTCYSEQGNFEAVDRELKSLSALVKSGARVGPQTAWYLPMYRASIALNQGDIAAAGTLLEETSKLGSRAGGQNFELSMAGLLAGVAYFTGAPANAAEGVEKMLLRYPEFWPWRTGRLFLRAAAGDLEFASGELPTLVEGVLGDPDQRMFRLACLVQLANVSADVGSREIGARLREELLPYADRVSVAGYGVMSFGSVARPLGNLCCLCGELDRGIGFLEKATRVCDRAGLKSWRSIASADLAAALRMRAAPGDAARARGLERSVQEFAARTGISVAESRIKDD